MIKYLANALATKLLFAFILIVITNNSLGQTYPDQELLDDIVYNNYTAPIDEFPNYLNTFIGSEYGNNITRISDATVFNTTSQRLRHNYAVDQVWNSDGTLLKLAGYPAAILDGITYEFLYWSDIPGYGRWSNTQPNIIYGTGGNRFIAHNVSTNQSTTLRTFSEYTDIDFGYGEGNQDLNDKYVGLIAENNNGRFLLVYDIQEDTIIGTRQIPSGDLDWFTVTTNGGYAVASWRANGTGETQGIKRYDIELTTETHIYDYSEHGDFGLDANGNEVYIQYGDETTWSNDYYITMIQIDNGQVTPLFHWSQSTHGTTGIWGGHISCRNTNRPGWAYVSEQCCPDHPVASKEIFAIKLDGSGVIERYAKHHNNTTPGNGHSTQAVPSRDGTKVLFASNWNNSQAMSNSNPPAWVVEVPQASGEEPVEVIANAGNDLTICEGETTILTASGGDTYLWNTGQTTASIEVQPEETTVYQVTVSIGDASDSDSITVNVTPLPIANAGNDIIICEDDSVILTASGGTSYLWNTGETSASITVSPGVTTNYSVEVTQNNCSSEDEVVVTVTPRQTINAGNDVTINSGESTTLSVDAMGDILWSTGETTSNITVSPEVSTIYIVTALYNDCESDTSVTVYVNEEIIEVIAEAGNDETICEGDTIILTATGGDNYLWNTGQTTASIEVHPDTTTIYEVTVSIDDVSDTDSVTVNVIPLPTIDVGNDVTIISGDSTILSVETTGDILWSTGETTSNITVSPEITTTYTVTTFNGICENEDSITVYVETPNELNVEAGEDTTICNGDSVILTASSGDSFLWNTGETTQSIEVSPQITTSYSVTVTQGNQSGSDSVLVTVNDIPEANVSSDAIIEIGNTILLSASGGLEYLWSTGDVTASISVSPLETTTYTVTVYENDCFDEASVTVTVEEPFVAYAGEDMNICRGEVVTLSVTEGDSYLWSTGETTQSIEVAPTNTTTYGVTVTNGITTSSDNVRVFVSNCNGNPSLDVDDQQNRGINLSVFPNPTSDIINVKLSGITNITSISLFDITGKVLINEAVMINSGEITKTYSLSNFNRGLYILTVSTNGYTSTKRVLVK